MREDEFIKYQPLENKHFEPLVVDAYNEAILAFAFAQNRAARDSPYALFSDLLKAALANGIFYLFLNQLKPTTEYSGLRIEKNTEFDFYFGNDYWYVLHNFIRLDTAIESFKLHQLPALIPNSDEMDFWSGREGGSTSGKNKKFVFTYMNEADLSGIRSVLKNKLNPKSMEFLMGLNQIHAHSEGRLSGWESADILDRFRMKTSLPSLHFTQSPTLYIGGIAGSEEFSFFADTDTGDAHGYALYTGRYYNHHPNGGLSFLNGVLRTSRKNATCPTQALPSFKCCLNALQAK